MAEKLPLIVPIRMDEKLKEGLQKEADKRERSLSWLIREFLQDGLERARRKTNG